ncbi:MAG: ABC transporter substrate-binding protein [Phycisphaerales bacterium]
MRVVSLVPSATEIVCAIGAGEWLVGRSHECDWPPQVTHLPALTEARTNHSADGLDGPRVIDSPREIDGHVRQMMQLGHPLYSLDTQRLRQLRPDVIITQDLCHVCSIDAATVRRIAAELSPAPRVISLNPTTLEGVLDDVLMVGDALDRIGEARKAVTHLREQFYAAADFVNPFADGPSVAVLEWTDPLFIAGHWTPQLVERAGGRHPLNPTMAVAGAGAAAGPIGATQRHAGKSVTVPPEVLTATKPEFVVIAPCGRTLEQARADAAALADHSWWRELPAVRNSRVALVDGNRCFSRPGPRLVEAFQFLVGWLNTRPDVIPEGFPWFLLRN